MRICENCGVNLDNNLTKCPLCSNKLRGKIKKSYDEYPKYSKSDRSVLAFRMKMLTFIFLSVITISLLINILTPGNEPWFIFVASPLIYVWLLIRNTIVSKSHYGTKLLLQLFGISFLVLVIDIVNNGLSWSVNYVIPALITISTLIITIRIYSDKLQWSEYFIFLILLVVLGFIPVVLYLTGVSNILWTGAGSALYSSLTLVAIFIFSHKKLINELIKKFHI